ncbi:hypothetical protein AQ621_13335 [Marinobacter sp. P4B1]|nr:hypothetical protein AQ621_13335 [Marinobacter sp. P4B1]
MASEIFWKRAPTRTFSLRVIVSKLIAAKVSFFDYYCEVGLASVGHASQKFAEPWMAEQKRHRDVP